jgi:long-chain acyl-CoA synthetase
MRWHNLGDLIDRNGNLDKEAIVDLALPPGPRIHAPADRSPG